MERTPFVRRSIALCFFFSGAAGLVYEVVWARQLGLFLGITSFAHTAVITAYMLGLAAGSYYFGRRADRSSNPLIVYAVLEIGIGAYAVFTPWLLDGLQGGYAGLAGVAGVSGMPSHLVRFAIALAVLLIPTFLMGGTLPLLVRGFVRNLPELGDATSRLYGLNTLGAMTGVLLTGYWFLPYYGTTAPLFIGAAVNFLIAVFVLLLMKSSAASESEPERGTDAGESTETEGVVSIQRPASGRAAILLAFGMAGFASLLTQVAWIKTFVMVVGGSVYAFTITLSTFLAGIALGSLAFARLNRSRSEIVSNPLALAAVVAVLICLGLLLSLTLAGRLPWWFLEGYKAGLADSFFIFQAFIFLMSFGVMILPTFFMGLLFPAVTVAWTRHAETAGQGVGTAYAINTVGTIFGALLGGLLILPWLGIQHSVQLAAGLYLLAALLFWLPGSQGMKTITRGVAVASVAVVTTLVVFNLPSWNRSVMAGGVFHSVASISEWTERATLEEVMAGSEMLFYAEGLDGTVVVEENDGQRYLIINGKTDATDVGDMPTQVMVGQVPAMIHPGATNALVIGLGSGVTAGSLATHPNFSDITVLELSREVVEASAFFNHVNRDVLSDPRVKIVEADARNFMLATDETYDLVVSQPSNPWLSGVSNLFTTEFFEMARSRLAPGGLMTQWVQIYKMSEDDLKTLLRTFSSVFPKVTIWHPQGGDLILVGSAESHAMDAAVVGNRMAQPEVRKDLQRIGIHSVRDMVRMFAMDRERLDRFGRHAPLNSDRRPVIEFSAPRNLYRSTANQNVIAMIESQEGDWLKIPIGNLLRDGHGHLRAPYMNLSIDRNPYATAGRPSAGWYIRRLMVNMQGRKVIGTGSEQRLELSEGESRLNVRYDQTGEFPTRAERLMQLKAAIQQDHRHSGDIDMPDGRPGTWLLADGKTEGVAELALTWLCPRPDTAFDQYMVHLTMPDPGDAWNEELTTLAARFRCIREAK